MTQETRFARGRRQALEQRQMMDKENSLFSTPRHSYPARTKLARGLLSRSPCTMTKVDQFLAEEFANTEPLADLELTYASLYKGEDEHSVLGTVVGRWAGSTHSRWSRRSYSAAAGTSLRRQTRFKYVSLSLTNIARYRGQIEAILKTCGEQPVSVSAVSPCA